MTELAHVGRQATAGELSSSIAHELNQPLGAILTNARDGGADPEIAVARSGRAQGNPGRYPPRRSARERSHPSHAQLPEAGAVRDQGYRSQRHHARGVRFPCRAGVDPNVALYLQPAAEASCASRATRFNCSR